jgi:hypothetical protein
MSGTIELHELNPVFMCSREASGRFKRNGPVIPIVEDQDRDIQGAVESRAVRAAHLQRTFEPGQSAESVES